VNTGPGPGSVPGVCTGGLHQGLYRGSVPVSAVERTGGLSGETGEAESRVELCCPLLGKQRYCRQRAPALGLRASGCKRRY